MFAGVGDHGQEFEDPRTISEAHNEIPASLEMMRSLKITDMDGFKLTDVKQAWSEQSRRVLIVP